MIKASSIRSPFKFLDPYQRKDRHIFFGRDEEVERVYESVNKNRVVLIYGQSGTGKTSLVQCGLANRFEITDWLPFFIRRGNNINQALYQALSASKALGGNRVDQEQLLTALETISNRYVRPVYLIFDQFEELMILGSQKEKAVFLDSIRALVESPATQSTHLLFILREEYFSWLDEFEAHIPGFSDRRLRVEPMRPNQLTEVIEQTCAAFDITLAEGRKNAQQIIENLRSKGGISLPYLQVYLDLLWRQAYRRASPALPTAASQSIPLTFHTTDLERLGNIENVLGRFLSERQTALQAQLEGEFPDFPANGMAQLLDAFVTEEGTKRPIYFHREADLIKIEGTPAENLYRQFRAEQLSASLEALEENRLLRADENSFELAHDSLAALIDQQRSDEQKQLNRVRSRVLSAFREYQETGEFLSEKQLNSMEDYFPALAFDTATQSFIQQSYREVDRKQQAARAEQERELREQKARAAKEAALRKSAERSSKRARRLAVLGFFLFFLSLAGAYLAFRQSQLAQNARSRAEEAQNRAEIALQEKQASDERFRQTNYDKNLQLGIAAMQQGNFTEAVKSFTVALTFDSLGVTADSLINVARENTGLKKKYEQAMAAGDQAYNQQNYLTAIRQYLEAQSLNLSVTSNRDAGLKVERVRVQLLPEFKRHLENAEGFLRAERKSFARRELSRAARIINYLDERKIPNEIRLYNRLRAQAK